MVSFKRCVSMAIAAVAVTVVQRFDAANLGVRAAEEKASGNHEKTDTGAVQAFDPFASAFLSMKDSMQFLSRMGNFSELFGNAAAHPITVKIPDEEEDSRCRVHITLGGGEHGASDLQVLLDFANMELKVTQQEKAKEVIEKENEEGKSVSSSASSFKSSISVALPTRCVANEKTTSKGYLGLIPVGDAVNTKHFAVVMPSKTQMLELVAQGLLPDSAESLDGLTKVQECLLMGFSEAECKDLGNVKPFAEISQTEIETGIIRVPKLLAVLKV